VDQLDTLLIGSSVSPAWFRVFDSCGLASVTADDVADASRMDRWALRVTGVPDHVLVLWDAESRWAGEVTIPLAEAVAREQRRAGPAGQGPQVWTPSPK